MQRPPLPSRALITSTACAAVCLASITAAALALGSPAQGIDLNAIIDGLQNKYSRMRGLEAEFVQLYRGANGQTNRESGRLLLKRPGKARWDYTSPERKV